jgi:hypothetical protein
MEERSWDLVFTPSFFGWLSPWEHRTYRALGSDAALRIGFRRLRSIVFWRLVCLSGGIEDAFIAGDVGRTGMVKVWQIKPAFTGWGTFLIFFCFHPRRCFKVGSFQSYR